MFPSLCLVDPNRERMGRRSNHDGSRRGFAGFTCVSLKKSPARLVETVVMDLSIMPLVFASSLASILDMIMLIFPSDKCRLSTVHDEVCAVSFQFPLVPTESELCT